MAPRALHHLAPLEHRVLCWPDEGAAHRLWAHGTAQSRPLLGHHGLWGDASALAQRDAGLRDERRLGGQTERGRAPPLRARSAAAVDCAAVRAGATPGR